jgi:hypothetical protein
MPARLDTIVNGWIKNTDVHASLFSIQITGCDADVSIAPAAQIDV